MTQRLITEREFVTNEERRLKELADLIDCAMDDFNVSCCEIARECGLDRRTAQKARRREAVNPTSEARIRLFIKRLYDGKYGCC